MKAGFVVVLLASTCFVAHSSFWPGEFEDAEKLLQSSTLELSEDGLSLMEPAIVPEPEDGGRWWYAPSRRSQMFSTRSKSQLLKSMRVSSKVGEDLRLPGDILPSIYAVKLLPFIEEGNFTTNGEVDIWVDCIRDTKKISLNAAEITFEILSIKVT